MNSKKKKMIDRYWMNQGKNLPYEEYVLVDKENNKVTRLFLVPIKC
jgi:hypothetical protein